MLPLKHPPEYLSPRGQVAGEVRPLKSWQV